MKNELANFKQPKVHLKTIIIILICFTFVLFMGGKLFDIYLSKLHCKYGNHNYTRISCTSPQICSVCEKEIDPPGHTFESDATGKHCIFCDYSEKFATQWGFYDLDKMDYALVRIYEYNYDSYGDKYVVASGEMLKFEDQYVLDWSFDVYEKECVFGTTSSPYTYTVVNNDNIILGNGYKNIEINERKTVNGVNDFVVLVDINGDLLEYDHWYVPYSLIDWERGAEVYTGDTHGGEYILYLK